MIHEYQTFSTLTVGSRKNDGQLTACEVLLFHYEDMGLPYEIAKLGVRHGMWGAVKKIEPGLRAYQKSRLLGEPISRPAYMARINTKVDPKILQDLKVAAGSTETNKTAAVATQPSGGNFPKFLLAIGGVVLLACGLNLGLSNKGIVLGGRRLEDMRKKMRWANKDEDLA